MDVQCFITAFTPEGESFLLLSLGEGLTFSPEKGVPDS